MRLREILLFVFLLGMIAPLFGQEHSKDMNPTNLVAALEGTWQHTSPDGRMTVKFVSVQMQMGPSEDAEVTSALYGFVLYNDGSITSLNYLHEIDNYESNQYVSFESFLNTPKDKIPQFILYNKSNSNEVYGLFSLLDAKYSFHITIINIDKTTITMKSIPKSTNEADLNIFPKEVSELTFTRVE